MTQRGTIDKILKPRRAGLQRESLPACKSEPVNKGVKYMQAIIVTGGKQYKVAEGDVLFIETDDAKLAQLKGTMKDLGLVG